MFEAMDEDIVFMETSMNLKHCPHMVLECISMPREVGDMSPIYFKVRQPYGKVNPVLLYLSISA